MRPLKQTPVPERTLLSLLGRVLGVKLTLRGLPDRPQGPDQELVDGSRVRNAVSACGRDLLGRPLSPSPAARVRRTAGRGPGAGRPPRTGRGRSAGPARRPGAAGPRRTGQQADRGERGQRVGQLGAVHELSPTSRRAGGSPVSSVRPVIRHTAGAATPRPPPCPRAPAGARRAAATARRRDPVRSPPTSVRRPRRRVRHRPGRARGLDRRSRGGGPARRPSTAGRWCLRWPPSAAPPPRRHPRPGRVRRAR